MIHFTVLTVKKLTVRTTVKLTVMTVNPYMSNSVGPPDNAGPESPDLWDRGNRYRSCKGEECAVQAEACQDIMDSRRLHSILLFLFSEMVIYCMYVLHGNKSGAWADSIASCGCIVLSM